ncbi:MAG: isoleucine--tRNA ligase, partial [Rikenellaceae bacterium]|nr:isoleucine--tRNA ligase [Rikenellaceae bacterium]
VKNIEYIEDTTGIMTKRIKPNFKTLGPRYGKQMKQISALVAAFSQNDIAQLERSEKWSAEIDGVLVEATIEDFEIQTEDIPGWLVASEGKLTVALDITITEELKREGIARELVNRIQNIRKESGFEVTDKITVEIERHEMLEGAIADYGTYIAQQTLAHNVALVDAVQNPVAIEIDETQINIEVRKSDM